MTAQEIDQMIETFRRVLDALTTVPESLDDTMTEAIDGDDYLEVRRLALKLYDRLTYDRSRMQI